MRCVVRCAAQDAEKRTKNRELRTENGELNPVVALPYQTKELRTKNREAAYLPQNTTGWAFNEGKCIYSKWFDDNFMIIL